MRNGGSENADSGSVELHLLLDCTQECRSYTVATIFWDRPHFGEVGNRDLLIPKLNLSIDNPRMGDDDGPMPHQEPVRGFIRGVIELDVKVSRRNRCLEDIRQEMMNGGMIPRTGRHDFADR